MKVLIVFRDTDDTDNLFVPILCNAIRQQGVDIRCSTREFWESDTPYDIIHFQWPEEAIGWNCHDVAALARFKDRIHFFRSKGARFVYTRHNVCPHYENAVITETYRLIESCSDTVVHMGQYSCDEFKEKYPETHSVVIPHHIYEYTYDETLTREEGRRRLHVPPRRFVITSFGKFRNKEEIRMTLSAFRRLKLRNKYLLAPRLFPFSKHPCSKNLFKRMASRIGYCCIPLLNRLLKMQCGASEELVPDSDLPAYLAVSDVVFIQRKKILNSGNVPLAFLFHKVVVGPDVGNVGEILRRTGNPVFNPDDPDSVPRALEQARELVEQGKGEENYRYALQHLSLQTVAEQYAQTYKETMTRENQPILKSES